MLDTARSAGASRFSPAAVTTEPDRSAHSFVLCARTGNGKTHFVSTIPGVFIVPVEEGLKGASPDHRPAHFKVVPRTFAELLDALDAFAALNAPGPDKRRPHPHLAIDSLTGIETLVHDAAMADEHAKHMDGKEYKVVWSAAAAYWLTFRKKLDAIRRTGTHVWLIAHAVETVEATEKGETFRKWDLSFRGTGASLHEVRQFWRAWADHVFFLDWTAKVTPGAKGKRAVAKYEGRVLHTRESATYFAKTRSRLPVSLAATWDDLQRAFSAGAAVPEARVRADITALLPTLGAEERAGVEAELAKSKGATRLAALLSRVQGLIAIANEEATAASDTDSDAEPEAPPETTTVSPEPPIAEAVLSEAADDAARAPELPADEVDEPADAEIAAFDPGDIARAEAFEKQIDERVGSELEAMPEAIKAAHLPEGLELRVRERYVARVKALRTTAREQLNGAAP